MKKIKTHFYAVLIIILMLIFGLGTSYAVHTRIEIKNNSSQNIKVRLYDEEGNSLSEYDEETNTWIEHSEEFIINRKETVQVLMLKRLNEWPEPNEVIGSIVIYNEEGKIIKEFNSTNNYEKLDHLFPNFRRSGSKNDRIFTFDITDAVLK